MCVFDSQYEEGDGVRGRIFKGEVSIFSPKEEQTQANTNKLDPRILEKHPKTWQQASKVAKSEMPGASTTFGCTTKETGLFKSQIANGIMGMGPNTSNKWIRPILADGLFKEHKDKNKNFSLCFGTKGGYLTFGGYNVNKHMPNEPVQTIKYGGQHYTFGMGDIGVGKPLNVKQTYPHPYIMDSGSSDTYFQEPQFNMVAKAFKKWCETTKLPKGSKGKMCAGVKTF